GLSMALLTKSELCHRVQFNLLLTLKFYVILSINKRLGISVEILQKTLSLRADASFDALGWSSQISLPSA
ncbi:hypothetical protein, partial [Bifidobacterium aquikefiri]|uniref:hypothetical protein n=1 Tax=Bifidobacterium aquikefiri TaxID=1653207 RepID=UPI0039EA04D7